MRTILKKILIDHTQVSDTLENFPVLLETSLEGSVEPADVGFLAADQATSLDHEIRASIAAQIRRRMEPALVQRQWFDRPPILLDAEPNRPRGSFARDGYFHPQLFACFTPRRVFHVFGDKERQWLTQRETAV